ncbi:vicilin-like seed storage protein At2g18540 [Diospyros lotus]|uniref:vicilin-like seed storage protein At2g18540 n=1 Tax=Diospyros lotus TaxID=55363 RepID=UPI00224F63C8|nr:vicilin-like seed storage protein At2g18540 [Diospyros lotus]
MVKDRSKSREEDDAENGESSKKARSGSKSKRKVEEDEEEVEGLDSESGSGSDDDGSRRSEEGRKRKRSRGSKRRSRRKYSDDDDSYSSSSADQYSDSGDSYSEHSSEDSETEEERRRRKRKERKRREERDKERRRRRKDKEKKRRRKERDEDDRKLKKKKKKRDKKHKDKKKDSERGKKGAVTNSWGKYGIIRETDMWNKRPEFTAWLAEVKQVNLESLPNWEEKQMFKEFMEDHNTTTFPSKKYYNLDAYFKHKIEKEIKKGIKKAPKTEMTVFNDEEQRRLELLQERERHKEEQVEALKRSMQGGMAQAMKEQAQLREEMAYHFRVGNLEAGAAIQRRLDPDVAM